MKKTGFFLLLAAAILMLLPAMAMAASPESDFNFNNGTIKGYDGTDVDVVIPSTIGGQAVTAISVTAFRENTSLRSIVIPSGVTTIANSVFEGCTSLRTALILGDVSKIPDFAFRNCASLEYVSIPSSVTSIGTYAFEGCTSLQSVHIPEGVTSIEYFAFNDCSSLRSVRIPEGVVSIGRNAFRGCAFTEAVIPKSVQSISNYVFYQVPLKELTFEGQPASIEWNAFASVESCTLHLPDDWKGEEPAAGNDVSWMEGSFHVKRAGTGLVTVVSDGHGTAAADGKSGKAGTEIGLTAVPDEGYAFGEWVVAAGGVTVQNDKFTMGSEDVTIVAAFKKSEAVHEHTFAAAWSKDESCHWHAATCEHTELSSGLAAHTWGTGAKANECTVCGYVKETPTPGHEHTFSAAWSKDESCHWHAATCEHSELSSGLAAHTWGTGEKANECTVCGYVKETPEPVHEHTFSAAWSKNEAAHWHAATCEHGELAKDIAAHTWGTGEKANECTVCGCVRETPTPGHEHSFAAAWSKNEAAHWHAATCEHSSLSSGLAAHTWGVGAKAGECTVCGYVKTVPAPVNMELYGIVVTTPPDKTAYNEGEPFDRAGMVVSALYAQPITGYTLSPVTGLRSADTEVLITYTENGITKSAVQPVTVGGGKEPYTIIYGAGQVIEAGAESATFSSDAEFSKFVRVEVDDKAVAKKHYSARSGSTVITFNRAYLAGLSEGDHTLRIVSADGSASTAFTVMRVPKTGDETHPMLWALLLLAGAAALVKGTAAARKRH